MCWSKAGSPGLEAGSWRFNSRPRATTGSAPKPLRCEAPMTLTEGTIDSYHRQFEEISRNGGSKAPTWLRELRKNAMARFLETGFPTTHEEDWRFTSVQGISETA